MTPHNLHQHRHTADSRTTASRASTSRGSARSSALERGAASLLAATLLATGPALFFESGIIETPAVATAEATTVFGNTDDLDISTINSARLVDVTFTLTGDNPYDDTPPGELPPADLAGYQVTVTEILGFDPRNAQDRQRAASLSPEAARLLPHGASTSALTDAAGIAKISGLTPGLYLVDVEAPQAEPSHKYKNFDPFLLMLPTGGIEGWDYVPIIALKEHPDDPPLTSVPITPPVPSHSVPTPDLSQQPTPKPGIRGIIDRLPMTGAQVISVLLASLCFIGAGAVLLFFGRRRRQEDS